MILETITVTPVFTSVAALIATAREISNLPEAQQKCTAIKLRCSADEDTEITIKEASTQTPVTILDAANGIYEIEIKTYNLTDIYLSCGVAKTAAVGVIVEQDRI